MKLKDILSDRASLTELSALAPSMWQEVISDLETHVKRGDAARLGVLRLDALAVVKRWTLAADSRVGATQHAKDEALRAKMTVMAVDQFSDVMTGRVGMKPSIKDRLIFKKWLLPKLEHGSGLATHEFDRLWRWFKDPIWAAGQLQHEGFWSVPTAELCLRIKAQAQGRPVLEIGAGRGLLTRLLHEQGVAVTGIDNFTWGATLQHAPSSQASKASKTSVAEMDAATALRIKKPSVVVCSWPPPANDFERQIFATPSVQLYLAVVSKHRFACGDWQTYQRQTQFSCTTSEPLNQLLRPLEAQQQVLIFRRR